MQISNNFKNNNDSNCNDYYKNIYIGIDISKNKFDVCVYYINTETNKSSREYLQVINNKQSILSFIKNLKKKYLSKEIHLLHIGMEATGRYYKELFKLLDLAGFNVSVLNPKRVCNFFRSCGELAKTDKKDSELIALYVKRMNPELSSYNPITERAKALHKRRLQLSHNIAMQKNYIEGFNKDSKDNKDIVSDINSVIRFLEKKLNKVNKTIEELISLDTELIRKKELAKTVPGIGDAIANNLAATLDKLGELKSGEISSLIGVAPKNKDSGKFRGKRFISGGRKDIRNALYMAALSNIRLKKSKFALLYHRLKQENKSSKTAIVAVMRKMIITVNSMIKYNTVYNNSIV